MDTVDQQTRSRIMSSVGQKNTGAEMLLRYALHERGIRYRLHDKKLPGSPDLVLPKFRAVIFVHGCYWHSHGCHRSTLPKTRVEFWSRKFEDNRGRDAMNVGALRAKNWRVMTVWECALKGKTSIAMEEVTRRVIEWLKSDENVAELSGRSRNTQSVMP